MESASFPLMKHLTTLVVGGSNVPFAVKSTPTVLLLGGQQILTCNGLMGTWIEKRSIALFGESAMASILP
jgi:hypothetical protein